MKIPRIYSTPTQFEVKEKIFSLSGDSFKIRKLDDDTEFFRVEGTAFDPKETKILRDSNDVAIYKLYEDPLSLRDRMYIVNAKNGEIAYTLRKKSILPLGDNSAVHVWPGENITGEPSFIIKGCFWKRNFSIIDVAVGETIGFVSKELFTLNKFLLNKDNYKLTVQPGVDTALFIILAVAIDEQYHD